MSAKRSRRRSRRRWLWRIPLFALGTVALVCAATVAVILPLRWIPPATSAFMWRSFSADPSTGLPCEEVEQAWVDGNEISPHLAFAVVLAEDQRFFEHRGLDFRSIERAMRDARNTGRVRGASTLTQQTAKNLFLWPGKSPVRKALEVWPTVWIEWLWPKQRILEVYLNIAQFGPCCFGAEAASQRFFDRSAAELEPEQAALLAAVLPNPKKLRAHNPGPYARERTQEILGLMQQHGRISRLRPRSS